MSFESNIDILLATYNGEKYLNQQIESILNQTCRDWRLLIRDDLSTDNTINIIKNYTSKYPDKIRLIEDDKGHLGLARNFGALLEAAQSEYIMFCDQDDIWLPNKIELIINVMKAAQQRNPDLPILVHTDLRVVDENLNVIADSFWKLVGIDPQTANNLDNLIIRNAVTGCAMMINRKAKEISTPLPAEVKIHDWWIAMNVAKAGKILFVPVPSSLYRQHGGNVISAGRKKTFRLSDCKNGIVNHYKIVRKVVPDANPVILIARILASEITRKIKRTRKRA
ncbi:MAG: glycosyltransferase family 2 protein [bacterium]